MDKTEFVALCLTRGHSEQTTEGIYQSYLESIDLLEVPSEEQDEFADFFVLEAPYNN